MPTKTLKWLFMIGFLIELFVDRFLVNFSSFVTDGRERETMHDALVHFTMTSLNENRRRKKNVISLEVAWTIYAHQSHRSKCENIYNYLEIYILFTSFDLVSSHWKHCAVCTLSCVCKGKKRKDNTERAKWIPTLLVQFMEENRKKIETCFSRSDFYSFLKCYWYHSNSSNLALDSCGFVTLYFKPWRSHSFYFQGVNKTTREEKWKSWLERRCTISCQMISHAFLSPKQSEKLFNSSNPRSH